MPFAITIHEDGTTSVDLQVSAHCPNIDAAHLLVNHIREEVDHIGWPRPGAYITTVRDEREIRREEAMRTLVKANIDQGKSREVIHDQVVVLLGPNDDEGRAMLDEILAELFGDYREG